MKFVLKIFNYFMRINLFIFFNNLLSFFFLLMDLIKSKSIQIEYARKKIFDFLQGAAFLCIHACPKTLSTKFFFWGGIHEDVKALYENPFPVVAAFTKKKKLFIWKSIRLSSGVISQKMKANYLAIILDSKLISREHFKMDQACHNDRQHDKLRGATFEILEVQP